MKLHQAFPQPSPVTLGGRRYLALPLRVKHLAAIEAFIAANVPNPAERYREAIAAAEGDERAILAAQAFLRAEDWPPKPSSPEGEAVINTVHGFRVLLRHTVEQCEPLDEAELLAIFEGTTPAEYQALCSFAYGVATLDELSLVIEPPEGPGPPPRSWGEILYDMCEGRPADLLAVGEMFVTQVSLLMSEGKAGDGTPANSGRGGRAQRVERRRSIFKAARERNAAEDAPVPQGQPDPCPTRPKRTRSSSASKAKRSSGSSPRK